MILLGGSLFGIQLGVIGTTYAKDYMTKIVMGVVMILVLFSLGLKVPVYLSEMGYLDRLSESTMNLLQVASYASNTPSGKKWLWRSRRWKRRLGPY